MWISVFVFLFAACAGKTGIKSADKHNVLRVGTSGDYEPFSYAAEEGGEFAGFEIELAKQFAEDQGMGLEFVQFRWPDLLTDLQADRFDVVMSGVTVRPDRSLSGRFTVPTALSGAVVIIPGNSKLRTMGELDTEGIRIGVNAGGHLERVTRKAFARAAIVTSPDNQAIPDWLSKGDIDALVTDTLEALHWLARLEGAKALPPFTQDRKAWLVQPGKEALARQLDDWLLAREADGTLARLRRNYLGEGNAEQTAAPLAALLAAMDERLSLMTGVAESKRLLGKPVEDLEQEARVLKAAVEGVAKEAIFQDKPLPGEAAVRAFFKAQIEAAKAIQNKVLDGPPETEDPPSDLVEALRPALGRISQRINRLLLKLPDKSVNLLELRTRVRDELSRHGLSDEYIDSIAESLLTLSDTVD